MDKMHLFDLPLVDVFDSIAQYLSCEDLLAFGVCSEFCRELVDRKITRLHDEDDVEFTAELFQRCVQICTRVHEFSISEVEFTTDEMFFEFFTNNPQLANVDVFDKNITEKGLNPLIYCENLVSLTLTNVSCDEKFLQKLCKRNNQLLQVEFSQIPHESFTVKGLTEFIAQQPQLRLVTAIFVEPEEPNIKFNLEPIIEALASTCKDLVFLNLSDYDGGCDELLMDLPTHCPKLRGIGLMVSEISSELRDFFENSDHCALVEDYFNHWKMCFGDYDALRKYWNETQFSKVQH